MRAFQATAPGVQAAMVVAATEHGAEKRGSRLKRSQYLTGGAKFLTAYGSGRENASCSRKFTSEPSSQLNGGNSQWTRTLECFRYLP